MTDKISKYLSKLNKSELELMLSLFRRIKAGDDYGLNIIELKGHKGIYRLRKGRIRIIYENREGKITILLATNRDDQTYRDF